jgi:hypothetical protein
MRIATYCIQNVLASLHPEKTLTLLTIILIR